MPTMVQLRVAPKCDCIECRRTRRAALSNVPIDPDADGVRIERPPKPVHLDPPAAARAFVAWMREMGLAGEYDDATMREFVEWWRAEGNVAAVADELLFRRIKEQRGVRKERKRLKRVRGDGKRTVFYRILERVSPLVEPVGAEPAHVPMLRAA